MSEITRLRDKFETDPDRRLSSAQWQAAHPEEAAKIQARLKAEAEARRAKAAQRQSPAKEAPAKEPQAKE